MPPTQEDSLSDVSMVDLVSQIDWDAALADDLQQPGMNTKMNIGVSLFSYDVNLKKPPIPRRPHFPRADSLSPSLNGNGNENQKRRGPTIEVDTAPNTTPHFYLDAAKEAEAKALIHQIDNNMGEVTLLSAALLNAYRGVITTAPAGLFGAETVEEAKATDAEMERAILSTSKDSGGLWRQILEGFAKYADAEGDPTLAKLQRRMTEKPIVLDDDGNEIDTRSLAERRIDRAIEADDQPHEPVWKHVTRLMGANVGWSPGAVVGKRLVPILMAVRPTPRIVSTALSHFPRMATPLGVLEVIRSYVLRYVQLGDSGRFIVDAVLRVLTPVLFPVLRFIARDSANAIGDVARLTNNRRMATITVGILTYFYRFVGWIWHVVVTIIHTIVRLIAAIIQFVIAIVVSIYATPVTGIIVNAVVGLIVRFVVR